MVAVFGHAARQCGDTQLSWNAFGIPIYILDAAGIRYEEEI